MKTTLKASLDQSGFTLVELIVAIMIVGVAGVGIASLFYTVQYTQRRSMYHDQATRAAQREIEYLRNNNYNSLTVGQTLTFTSDLPALLPGNKSGTVQISEPNSGVKRVDVTVTYYDNGTKREVNMSSLIGAIGLTR